MTWECDSNGHMNVMYYINKFEHAGRNTSVELGLQVEDPSKDIGVVVLEQTIKYYKEVFEDDLIYIESELKDISNKTFTVFHTMYNNKTKEKVATMNAILVGFDKIKRKAIPFPEDQKKAILPT